MAEVPKKIGRYEVERMLGAGAMGYVYLARDPTLERFVAIKTVRKQNLPSDSMDTFLERFRNEARAAAKLHHRSIVQVYDVGDDETVGPYLVFEYVPGFTLKQILRAKGALSPEAACLLADEVADALTAAHHRGIIHRDIKPDNLLVTEDGHTKLADFGVARLPDAELTREGQFLGTPCYAAPETLRGGKYGPDTDVFSMATVLYEAVTGVRAFPGDDAVAVAHKVIHDVPDRPSVVAIGTRVPREVDSVFRRALEKSPRDRYGSPHDLARALRAAYEDAGVLEPARIPTGSFVTPPRETSVRPGELPPSTADTGARTLATAAVALGTLVIGIALVIAWNRSEPPPPPPLDASVVTVQDAGRVDHRPQKRPRRGDSGFVMPTTAPPPSVTPTGPSLEAPVPEVSPVPSPAPPIPAPETPPVVAPGSPAPPPEPTQAPSE